MKNAFKQTVADILNLTYFRDSDVLAGKNGLNRTIKWVHILEVTEIGQLLNGHELILTTGVGWKENQELSFSFLKQLIEKNASGLCIELGKYTNAIPEEMMTLAEENNFPLITFNKEVRFIDITQDINTLLMDSHYRVISNLESFSNKLNHLLLFPNASTAILKLLHTHLNAQVVYAPVEGKAQFVPLIDHSIKYEVLIEIEKLRMNETRHHQFQSSKLGIIVCQPIEALGHKFANLYIILQSMRMNEYEFLLLDRAATALAQNLSKELYVEEKRKHEENQWVQNWLRGDQKKENIHDQLKALDPSLNVNGCVVCICKIKANREASDFTYNAMVLRSIFEQNGYFLLIVNELNRLVFLLVNSRTKSDWKKRMRQAIEQLERKDLLKGQMTGKHFIGVGNLIDDISKINESYEMACDVLYVHENSCKNDTLFFEDLYTHRLISQLNKQGCLQSFINDYLGVILDFDALHGSNMRETLEIYLDVNGSKKEAARRLFIVRQTLYHRIEKLKELLGEDFMKSEKRLALEFAVHAYHFLHNVQLKSNLSDI